MSGGVLDDAEAEIAAGRMAQEIEILHHQRPVHAEPAHRWPDLGVGDPAMHHDPDGIAGHELDGEEDEDRHAEQHRDGVEDPLEDIAQRSH